MRELEIDARGSKILGEASNRVLPLRVELHAIHARETGSSAAHLSGKTRNSIEADSRRGFSLMRDGNFNAIGKMGNGNFKRGVAGGKILERLGAGRDRRGLELGDGIVFQTSSVGEIACGSAGCRSEAGVGVNLQTDRFRLSRHWY